MRAKKTLLRRLDNKALHVTVRETLGDLPPTLVALGAEVVEDHKIIVRYRPSETVIGEILEALRAANLSILDLSTEETDLEDIFLQLTRQPDAAVNHTKG